MSKIRVIFMGTPDFAVPCLTMLVNGEYDVQAVVSQPDRPKGRGQKLAPSPVKEAALSYGIPVLTPPRIRDAAFIENMRQLHPDIIIVVAFGQFLPKELLDLPRLGCVNVHASLLPQYRGAAPIHWAIINGEKTTGITTMYMDVGMDTGDMLLKAEVAIGADDTTGDLHDVLKEIGARVLSDTLRQIVNGTVSRTPQDHTQATYAPMLTRDTEKINWQQSAKEIHNLIRGLNPWPGAYCLHQTKALKIWKTKVCSGKATAKPGQVICGADSIRVSTGEGDLELLEVQPESKRRMSADEYLRGYACDNARLE